MLMQLRIIVIMILCANVKNERNHRSAENENALRDKRRLEIWPPFLMLAWSSARRLIFFLALWRWPALAKGDSAENSLRNKEEEDMAAEHY